MQRRSTKTPPGAAPTREIELKLALSAHELPRLRQRLAGFGDAGAVAVDNVYFDTADGLLRGHRMALRVRRIGRRWVQTLKTEAGAGALSSRGEWELPAPRGRLDLGRFPETPLAALLRSHPQARLRPVFRTRFRRSLWRAAGGAVEIALDEGEIIAGDRRAPILELELELKSGQLDALYRLALALAGKGAAALTLRPAVDSKAVRGYRLAANEPPAPIKANAAAVTASLAPDASLPAAMRHVAGRGATLLLANAAGGQEVADPEFVHQARVAVRRIRSASRALGRRAGWPAVLDRELRWIARRLGKVRDWDVLQAHTLPALLAAVPAAAPLDGLAARARVRDDHALREALGGVRYARLALRLLRWVNSGNGDEATLAAVANLRLARLHRRLFDAAEFFAALPVRKQHRVRILAKRLRYALDLFASTLPALPAKRYVARLAQLQDELGALNDAVVAAELLRRLPRAAGDQARPADQWLQQQRLLHSVRAERSLADLLRRLVPWGRSGGA